MCILMQKNLFIQKLIKAKLSFDNFNFQHKQLWEFHFDIMNKNNCAQIILLVSGIVMNVCYVVNKYFKKYIVVIIVDAAVLRNKLLLMKLIDDNT